MSNQTIMPKAGSRLRVGAIPGLASLLALLPALALFAGILLGPKGAYLLRRDENILLVILATLDRGWRLDDIFVASISPGVFAALRAVSGIADVVHGGRALAMLSGIACLVLTSAIARRLYGPGPIPALAVALLASSSLFIYEATIIRPNMPSLAFAMAAVLALLSADWQRPTRAMALAVVAGLLYGLAVQIKALALALAPLLPFLLWQILHRPGRPTALAAAALTACLLAGGAGSALIIGVALGPGGPRLDQILAVHLSASSAAGPLERLSFGVTMASQVLLDHMWLAIVFTAGLFRALGAGGVGRAQAALIGVWCGAVATTLIISFPSWDHHYIYLLPALAIGAAALTADAAKALLGGDREGLVAALAALGLALAVYGAAAAGARVQAEQPGPQERAVASMVGRRTSPGATVWSDNLIFPLLTGRPTDPTLADLSIKRIIAGQLHEDQLFTLMATRPPAAIIYYDGLFAAFPRFTSCLDAGIEQTTISLNGQRVYWLQPGDAQRVVACGVARQ